MSKDKMVPGCEYYVTMEDCCIEGEFIGEFVEWTFVEYEVAADAERRDKARFKVGPDSYLLIGPIWGAWDVEAR
jgi:hypothetical protein